MTSKKIYGVIDIGTLKVKTEIASVNNEGSLERLYASNTLTRFGIGLETNGGCPLELHLVDTINELNRIKKEFKNHRVTNWRVVSTHAMRQAKNQNEIIKRVKQETGFEIENLTQAQEASLFFEAVIQTFLLNDQKYAVMDVGGGSVQITVGTKNQLLKSHLMRTGTVTLQEKFIKDPRNPESFTTEEDIEHMKEFILKELMMCDRVKGVPLVYGSSMVIDVMKIIKIPLDIHENSKAHPYKTYVKHLEKFMKEVIKLKFGERDECYKDLPHHYGWGIDKGFLNAITVAEYFHSPYIIPSNANMAQGIIFAMHKTSK